MVETRVRLGDILIDNGYITEDQLEVSIKAQKNNKSKRLGEIMLELGFISEDQLLKALSKRLDIKFIDFNDIKLNKAIVEILPKRVCLKYNMIVIESTGGSVTLAINDPLDLYAIEDVKSQLGVQCNLVLARKNQIGDAINRNYSEIDAINAAHVANESIDLTHSNNTENLETNDDLSPVVNLVNSILLKAHSDGASDIHFEPFENFVNVRLRIDGQLIEYMKLEGDLSSQLTTRIKIVSDLNIAERRVPQDGNFKISISNKEVSIRVSTIPTVFGEKIVLRFLSTAVNLDNSGTYGMNLENYKKITKMLTTPHGIVYITGPTGSGKTTTLYMMIERMTNSPINISTIEDPVERNIPKVNQVQINEPAGLTFETGLRSMLRQDPDVILVGETRDSETANIAVSAAITGHLVLSTLHTNDAISSVVRLVDMGIESYLLANSLAGVVAQRLIKKVCPFCKEEYFPTEEERNLVPNATVFYKGRGCHNCNDSGYKGRIAVHEILEIDPQIRRMISARESTENIYTYVREHDKLHFIKDNIITLIEEGVTTIEELLKQTAFVV